MQKLSKIALFGLIGLFLLPLGYSALTEGLVGYWKMNEGSGTSIADLSGLGHTGLATNTNWTNGVNGYALNFSLITTGAASSRVNVTSTALLKMTGNITFSAWVNFWNLGLYPALMSKGQHAASKVNYIFGGMPNPAADLKFTYNDGTFKDTRASDSIIPYNLNRWTYITIVVDKTASQVHFYVNGTLNNTQSCAGSCNYQGSVSDWDLLIGTNGNMEEVARAAMSDVALWNRSLSSAEISSLFSASGVIISINISDYNLTAIYDNSSIANNLVRFNVSYDLNFTGVNASGVVVPQLLTLNISDLGIFENITSNVARATIFNNTEISNYTVIVTDPFNESLSLTTYYIINEIVDIRDRSLTHFNYFNTSVNLNFSSVCLCGGEFFADVYNLTIPALNISMRENTFGTADAVTFNNSNVYNYTVYVTHERFGNLVNKTFYFYTNAYNISIPTYNSTIANNSYTDIAWYLTTVTGYASSNQSINHSIVFNGVTTYPTATGLNYTYQELQTTNNLVENIPFYLILNLTLGNESLLFNQSYTLTITTIQINDCSTYSNVLLNLSMLNEIGKTLIANVTSIIVNFNISNALISVEVINDTDGIIPICINNTAGFYADVEFQFSGVGYGATDKYTREHFYINNYFVSNNTQQQSTYQLTTDLALKKVFTIYDSSDNPLPGHYVVVKKWYGDGYETVAMAKTDANGQALTYVQYYNVYYALDILDEDGNLIFTVSKNLFSNADDTIRVTDTIFTQYEALFSTFDTSKSYNETSNVFSTTIVNNQGTESIIRIVVKDKFGIIQCDDTYTTSSVTATCTIPSPEGNSYTAQAYATVGGQTVYLYIFEFDEAISTFEDYGELGSFFAGLIVLGLSLVGSLFSFASIPFMAFIGVMISTFLGFIALDAVTLAGVGVMAVLIMVWFLRK